MKIEVIASTRKLQGTGASRRLRRANKVPGIIYGGDNKAPTMIEIDHNPLFHAMTSISVAPAAGWSRAASPCATSRSSRSDRAWWWGTRR